MSDNLGSVASNYEAAKRGRWAQVLSAWGQAPQLARECSRFQKPSSGWSFLHQAAYFGHELAARELISLGATLTFLHGRLVAVNMTASSYRVAVRAVTSKYGQPSFGRFDGKKWTGAKSASFGLNTAFDWDLRGGRVRVGRLN